MEKLCERGGRLKTRSKFLSSLLVRGGFVLASMAVTLLLCEAALRLFYPKYRYAAESSYTADDTRIWSRNPGSRYQRAHPDTGRLHWVIHNNLGLRQHRDFEVAALEEAMNVGVFGDSFVENLRLPAPYSLSEPLDYLLNRREQPANVLNFGVDGYGTDQAYLAYKEFPQRHRLGHVFYFFCANDVRNVYENRLFRLDENGALVRFPAKKPALWVRVLGKFHLTYLVIEAIERTVYRTQDANKRIDLAAFLEHAKNYHTPEADRIERSFQLNQASEELTASLKIIQKVLAQWRDEVEAQGGRFRVVLLPRGPEAQAATSFREAGLSVVNLHEAFNDDLAAERAGRSTQLSNDPHWNELGNMLAAWQLYDVIAADRGGEARDRGRVREALAAYYAAFDLGWSPEFAENDRGATSSGQEAIRRKYLAAELMAE